MKSKKMVNPSSASYLQIELRCSLAKRYPNNSLYPIRLEHCAGPGVRARARDRVLFGQLLAKLGFKQLLLLLLHPPDWFVRVETVIMEPATSSRRPGTHLARSSSFLIFSSSCVILSTWACCLILCISYFSAIMSSKCFCLVTLKHD